MCAGVVLRPVDEHAPGWPDVGDLSIWQGLEEDVSPDWACGLAFPVGAVIAALGGFVIACMWISTVADELVGVPSSGALQWNLH